MESANLDEKPKLKAKKLSPITIAARAVGIPQNKVLSHKVYGDEIVVVTIEGKKLRGRLPRNE